MVQDSVTAQVAPMNNQADTVIAVAINISYVLNEIACQLTRSVSEGECLYGNELGRVFEFSLFELEWATVTKLALAHASG